MKTLSSFYMSLILSSFLLACGGHSLDLGDTYGGADPADEAVDDAGVLLERDAADASWSPVSDTIPFSCNEPPGDELPLSSADELQSLVLGRWIFCKGPQRFWTNANVAGLEFTNTPAGAGTTFYFLYVDPSNYLVRGTGLANQASFTWLDEHTTGPSGGEQFALNIIIDASTGEPPPTTWFTQQQGRAVGLILHGANQNGGDLYAVRIP